MFADAASVALRRKGWWNNYFPAIALLLTEERVEESICTRSIATRSQAEKATRPI